MDAIEILNLSPGDLLETAEKNFRALALLYHPDKNPGNPEAEKKYREASDAIQIVRKNPSVLEGRIDPADSQSTLHCLVVRSRVSLEDIYFRKRKSVTVQRQLFCGACQGTGSKRGRDGVCRHCDGEGTITSSILSLLNTDNVCPVCEGTGVMPGTLCETCGGSKKLLQTKTLFFTPDVQNHTVKNIILRGVGHQIDRDKFGNVSILLSVSDKPKVGVQLKTEDNYFVAYYKVNPVQRIIGDIGELNIFGRKVPFKIERGSEDAWAEDKIGRGSIRAVRIRYVDYFPKLTKKTHELYLQIMEIEKRIQEKANAEPA